MSALLTYPQAVVAGPGEVGGKSWNLARLARWGFPTPRGIAVSASAYDDVVRNRDVAALIAKAAAVASHNVAEPAAQAALAQIREAIGRATLSITAHEVEAALARAGIADRPVAVRSSATGEDGDKHAFAGIHLSVLNVRGCEAILAAIRRCYTSLWTPQAIVYRRRFSIPDADVRCGLAVCEMICAPGRNEPLCAGVMFTADPTDGRRDRFVIESVAGLADKLVEGRATPARAHLPITQTGLGALEGDLGTLNAARLQRLAEIGWRIHWAFSDGDRPQDIEWAFDGDRFVIVQTRPITMLPRRTFPQIADQPTIWTNANFREVLPGVLSPMGWSGSCNNIGDWMFDVQRAAGYDDPPGLQIVRRIEGRAYFNSSIMQFAFFDAFGTTPREFNAVFGGLHAEISVDESSTWRGRAGLARFLRGGKLMRVLLRLPARLPAQVADIEARTRTIRKTDLSGLSSAHLLQLWFDLVGPKWRLPIMLAGSIGSSWLTVARVIASRYVNTEEIDALLSGLMTGQGGVVSAEHAYTLQRIARELAGDEIAFNRAIDEWLERFGHHCVGELDVGSPRWAETPEIVAGLARQLATSAHDPSTALSLRNESQSRLRQMPWGVRHALAWVMRKAEEGVRLREVVKSGEVAIVAAVRHVLLAFGDRLVAAGHLDSRDDVFLLSEPDVYCFATGAWSGEGARELAADRRTQRESWIAEPEPPGVIVETEQGTIAAPSRRDISSSTSGSMNGIAASPGVADGLACKLHRPDEAVLLSNGGVLVARSTDPAWTPLFLKASAIAVETGSYLSHSAIVAREFGVPAVVNVAGLFDAIIAGQRLRVDGNAGRIDICA